MKQLDSYRKKRRFDETPEPDAKPQKKSRAPQTADKIFVIQKHAARRLHYDFRLELDGTLKSWAIPKGPSLDPAIKRMAVHVEDHPLDYANFEGTIPAGNYGAGTVIVWDAGVWTPLGDAAEGYKKGHLKFELHGEKLHGHWHLVRAHLRSAEKGHSAEKGRSGEKDSWLLIKERDDAARPAAQYDIVEAEPNSVRQGTAKKIAAKKLPEKNKTTALGDKAAQPLMLAPQLATLVDSVPRDKGWIYEIKFDGYRILTRINAKDGVHLFTRNGNDWTNKLKRLTQSIAQLKLADAWLDGEIVMLDQHGISHFQQLQNAFENAHTERICYMLFDILYYSGRDLRAVPLLQRRALLQQLLADNDNATLRFSDHVEAKPAELIDTACRMQIEGLIGKRADAPYTSGRTRDWIKLKCLQRQEFVIGGYTEASHKNVRAIGALLLGVHDEQGNLRYAGKVGTGFTQQSSLELREKLQPLIAAKSPFANSVRQAGVHWVKPQLLAEIAFAAWTDDGHIRHSSFQGLRSDKPAAAITREQPLHTAAVENSIARKTQPKSAANIKTARAGAKSEVAGIAVSHPDRVIDKTSGATKYDLVRFYETVATQLLAHLKDRPVSLVRAPAGVGGEIFFQKHRGSIDQLIELDPALLPGHPALIAIDSLASLIACVQMNVVEFHTWNARLAHIEQPDRMIFDLDPGEGIVWPQMVEAAQLLKSMLDELRLNSFLKTSGGKGLHVVVPLTPRDDWQTVRDFSETLVRHMAKTIPQLFVATSGPKNRINRIFIDYLRNNRGSTTAAAFTARLRPGLGVSVPMAWQELNDLQSSAQWHIGNIDKAVAAERAATWRDYARVKQTLARAQKILAAAN